MRSSIDDLLASENDVEDLFGDVHFAIVSPSLRIDVVGVTRPKMRVDEERTRESAYGRCAGVMIIDGKEDQGLPKLGWFPEGLSHKGLYLPAAPD